MNIVLITDLHIGKEGEDTYGVDVRKNFLTILKAIKEEQADAIVINGDLCFDEGESAIYQWIKKYLDQLSIPYYITVGNHDNGEMMAEVFDLQDHFHNGCLYFTHQFDHWKGIFLDTGIRRVSEEQLQWLTKELQSAKQPVAIFMHHPPIISGVPFMDKNHALDNMIIFQEMLADDARTIPIFSGHYHVEKTVCKGNITLQITPSCYCQIAQRSTNFEVDHYKIAYRKIKLLEDSWTSTVKYMEGHKL